jgi:hypothetical protein
LVCVLLHVRFTGKGYRSVKGQTSLGLKSIDAPEYVVQQTSFGVQYRVAVLGDDADSRRPFPMQNQAAGRNPGPDDGFIDKTSLTFLGIENMDGAGMDTTIQELEVAVWLARWR